MPRPRIRDQYRERLLKLIREARFDHPQMSQHLEMAPATLSRLLRDLREEGHRIVSVREGSDRYYMLLEEGS